MYRMAGILVSANWHARKANHGRSLRPARVHDYGGIQIVRERPEGQAAEALP